MISTLIDDCVPELYTFSHTFCQLFIPLKPIWGLQTFKTGLEYDLISEIDFYGFNISGVIDRRWELCEKLLTREELW